MSNSTPHANADKRPSGFFVNIANWILSRLPWFETRYQKWSGTKRILIALPLYLVVLPIIPIIIAIIMYIRDPKGFTKSTTAKVLGAIIVAQLAAFGLVATQEPVPDTLDNSDNTSLQESTAARQKVQSKSESEATNGRFFENCTEAFDAGVFDIAKNDESYRPQLDGDDDGVACEK